MANFVLHRAPVVALSVAVIVGSQGCHTQHRVTQTTRGNTSIVVDQTTASGTGARLAISDQGRWRFEVPLQCSAQEFVELTNNEKIHTRPNVATFVVGIVVATLGGVVAARGFLNDNSGSDPLSYAGPMAVATGTAFMIGPWFGNGIEDVSGKTEKSAIGRKMVPCGARPLSGKDAVISFRATRLYGTVNDNGEFSQSPFQNADVFDLPAMKPWNVQAKLTTQEGAIEVSTVVDGSMLAQHKDRFVGSAGFDAKLEPLRLVPQFASPVMRVSLTKVGSDGALRISLKVQNENDGESWQLRARIESSVPDVDGRMLYLGYLGPRQTLQKELLIPLAPDAVARLQGAELTVSAQLLDAHGTTPASPVRFSGAVLNDVPR
jgi:hypothetical protein